MKGDRSDESRVKSYRSDKSDRSRNRSRLGMKNLRLKQYLIASIFLFLLISPKSNAGISLEQNTMTVPNFDFNKIFNGLSLPKIDFSQNTRQINQDVSNLPFEKYKTDFIYFISSFGLNNFFRDIFSFFIGVVKLLAGIVVWILQFIIQLIQRGLSFIS